MKYLFLWCWVESLNVKFALLHPSPTFQAQKLGLASSSVFSQQKHEAVLKGTFNFPDNAVCSRQVLMWCFSFPPSVCRDSLAFVTCIVWCQLRVQNLHQCTTAWLFCFLQIIIMGNSFLAVNNCHVPLRRGRELCYVAWCGLLMLTVGNLGRRKRKRKRKKKPNNYFGVF